MMTVKIAAVSVAGLLTCLIPQHADAQVHTVIVEVPTGWKIQNYIPNGVTIWFAPTNCVNGNLSLPAHATEQDRDRLWALLVSAKISQTPVQIYYNRYEDGRSCEITSFAAVNT